MIVQAMPYPAASGPTGDVTIAVQDFETGTALGDVDTTATAFGGETPDAALVLLSFHEPANAGTPTSTAMMGLGIVDSLGNQGALYTGSMDGVTYTRTNRGHKPSLTVNMPTANTSSQNFPLDKEATGTLIADGLRLSYSTNSSGKSRKGAMMLFGGADLQAKRVADYLGNDTTPRDQTGVGFQPDAVIAIGNMGGYNTSANALGQTIGFATADGTQRCVVMSEATVQTAAKPFQAILTNAAISEISSSDGSLSYSVAISNFDADGFTLTPSAAAANDHIEMLAVKGTNAKIVDFDSPTATGQATIGGAGFTPRAAIIVLTNLTATDTFGPTDDSMSGVSIGLVADETWAAANRVDSGADPTDTDSIVLQKAIIGPSATDITASEADLVEFTSDGMTLNWTAVQASAKKGFVLFLA